MQSENRDRLSNRMWTQLETVHALYEISAGFLSQMHTQDIMFVLLRSLVDELPHALSSAFYTLEGPGEWRRARVYVQPGFRSSGEGWTEGEVWPGEAFLLERCRETRRPAAIGLDDSACDFVDEIAELGAQQVLYYPLILPNIGFTGVVGVSLGEAQPLEVHQSALVQAIVQQGTVAFMHGVLYERSVTNETQMQAILESSRDGILLVSPERRVHYLNRRAREMLGLDGGERLPRHPNLVDVIEAIREGVPELANWLATDFPAAPASSSSRADAAGDTLIFTTVQGSALKLQYWPVYARGRDYLGSLYLLRDVTEQRRLERMRDDVFHMVVHDLRNPLSTIQNVLAILQDPDMPDVRDEVIEIAQTSSHRMMELINAILEIGRLEAGTFGLRREVVPLKGFLEAMTQEASVSRQDVDVQLDIPASLPDVWADPAIAMRILDNLMNNALKFARAPDGLIRITAAEKESWAEICIYNNGPHIPSDLEQHLFQKFVTGESDRHGYGLGLAFCQLAVEAHGGRIWAENRPEGGVTFCFTLPAFKTQETAPPG